MRLLVTLCLLLSTSTAFAHVGVGATSGFMVGFGHPLGGLDHALAMVAVGVFAASLGGRALLAVPLTFVAVMALGGALGAAGAPLPFVELAIALSVVALGLAVAFARNWPVAAAMAFVGAFALFHGHAHGTEMPLTAGGFEYAAGFLVATGLLHVVGLGLGLQSARLSWGSGGRRAVRLGGVAISLVGTGILSGLI